MHVYIKGELKQKKRKKRKQSSHVWIIRIGVFLGIKLNKEEKGTRKAGIWGWNTSKFLMLVEQLIFPAKEENNSDHFSQKGFFR